MSRDRNEAVLSNRAAEENNASERDDARRARRAERRRRIQAREFDDSVPSPCIAVCQLDSRTDLCIGCQRSVDEIREWPIMTAEEKRATLARIEERKRQSESSATDTAKSAG
jgi:predicted Fe-S protein YdhL (DUF1289 family)